MAQALEAGHEVTAFARNPDKIKSVHKNLQAVKGDMFDSAAVSSAVKGQDAVICTLGMPIMNRDKLRAKGTATIVGAMQKTGVKRLICLSMLGVGDSMELLPFHYKYLIIPFILGRAAADHSQQEKIVRNSKLDWVIVRPGNFTDGLRTGRYRHEFGRADQPPTLKISKADVAEFMLKQLVDNTWLHRAPGLSY